MSEPDMVLELIGLILVMIAILYVWKKLSDSGLALPY